MAKKRVSVHASVSTHHVKRERTTPGGGQGGGQLPPEVEDPTFGVPVYVTTGIYAGRIMTMSAEFAAQAVSDGWGVDVTAGWSGSLPDPDWPPPLEGDYPQSLIDYETPRSAEYWDYPEATPRDEKETEKEREDY